MDLKIFTQNIEQKALDQIHTLLAQEAFKDAKVRIMPDVHAGKGCVIGFTANLGNKVIPNIVGVDIGCGVLCANLGKVDIDLESLDKFIKDNIPSGRNLYEDDVYISDNMNKTVEDVFLKNLYCYKELKNIDKLNKSLGTLGGGNHFIEIDVDENNNKYILIHTGSRNLGKQVADIYQHMAVDNIYNTSIKTRINDEIEKLKLEDRTSEIETKINEIKNQYYKNIKSISKDLCYLEGVARDKYLHDMHICMNFAMLNRYQIVTKICKFLDVKPIEIFTSVHNYISKEDIIRKGAVSANKGERVIIPLNMRDGALICVGKGNDMWNQSAPHGAGRIMSRNSARETLKLEDFKKAMENIYTTTATQSTIDECPMAYKDANEIIDAIKDTVEIINVIKPIYNFKATD